MGGRAVSDGIGMGAREAVGERTRTTTTTTGRGNEKNKAASVKQKEKQQQQRQNNNKAKLPHRMRANGSYFGRLNVRISIYLIYACCYYLLLIMAAAGSNNVVNGLKCYCNPKECDVIRALDCPGKGLMLWDPCQ